MSKKPDAAFSELRSHYVHALDQEMTNECTEVRRLREKWGREAVEAAHERLMARLLK